MAPRPVLYVDPQSPYAYLADARFEAVVGVEPELCCITLGAFFARRGFGSWGHTPDRPARAAECERRAAAYGLPPLRWPDGWPVPSLAPARAGSWAAMHGALRPFLRAFWELTFAGGEDPSSPAVLRVAADRAGLAGEVLEQAIGDPAVKDRLRADTDAAWDLGVRGVPTTRVGDRLLYGDDALEDVRSLVASA